MEGKINMNFEINSHKATESLFFDLSGIFDEASALLLADRIMLEGVYADTIFVDTDKLKKVEPCGKAALENLIGPKRMFQTKVVFTGKNSREIGWVGCQALCGESDGKQHKCSGKCKNCKCNNNKSQ